MAINFRKYVDITSGVGGGAGVAKRQLIARIYTQSPLVPEGTVVEMDYPEDVSNLFGPGSEEYKRAAFYFGWVSKTTTRAKMIAFYHWNAIKPDQHPSISGRPVAVSPDGFANIEQPNSLSIVLDGTAYTVSDVDFTGVTKMSDVAAILQAAFVATGLVGTTVKFTTASGIFGITLATGASAKITGNVLDVLTGFDAPSYAGNQAGLTDYLNDSTDLSNNFGSYLFMPDLTVAQHVEVAQWNATQNVMYQYMVRAKEDQYTGVCKALMGYAGVGVTHYDPANTDEYPEMAPMMVLAATDYTRRNATQNYMYQQFALTPTVSKTPDSDAKDKLRLNYYGVTQTAGQYLAFYQRGVLMGGATAPTDMNTYANEQWLKDSCGAAIMTLQLAMPKVSANSSGRGLILGNLQSVISDATKNGTISIGKPLDQIKKSYITDMTDDPTAWQQVQNIGYWLDCALQSYVTQDGRTEWKATYLLIYSKDDVIRKVEGTHTLI